MKLIHIMYIVLQNSNTINAIELQNVQKNKGFKFRICTINISGGALHLEWLIQESLLYSLIF